MNTISWFPSYSWNIALKITEFWLRHNVTEILQTIKYNSTTLYDNKQHEKKSNIFKNTAIQVAQNGWALDLKGDVK